jgi:hypothetical protein
MRQRPIILVALLVGIASFLLCTNVRIAHYPDVPRSGDFWFPLCAAKVLLAGGDPYGDACRMRTTEHTFPPNPLTTALVVVPFVPFGKAMAGPFLFGTISGVLAAGLLQQREWWRLLTFVSGPYWIALMLVQWSPLLLALLYFPLLLPLTLVKPHVGLPVFLTRMTWKRTLACAAFGLFSLAIDPTWPLRWLPQIQSYTGFIALLVLPAGPLLLAALYRWRDEHGRFLLFMSLVPQRSWYDALLLWWLPRPPLQMIVLTLASWVGLRAWQLGIKIEQLVVTTVYLPALLLLLFAEQGQPAQVATTMPVSAEEHESC